MAERELREINRLCTEELTSCIQEAEDRYHGAIWALADELIADGQRRVVLLAGPSSSGKTTTANMLADRLTALGHKSIVVSLDNFYRDSRDPDYPRLPDGSRDLECVDALQVSAIHHCIEALVSGKSCPIPRYDFHEGKSTPDAFTLAVPAGGFAVIEGLHALNPRLIEGLPREGIFKLFVSVSTNLNADGRRILSGRKLRFIRRLTRDHLYRGASAQRTLSLWRHVIEGEDKYLYPFKSTADQALNTFHTFELGTMRPFTLAALDADLSEELNCDFIHTVRGALEAAVTVPLSAVPKTSLIREFVPGGIYENLYR